MGPFLLAVLQVVGTAGAAHGQPTRRPLDGLSLALLVLGPAALWAHRRAPRVVCATVVADAAAYLVLNYPYGPVFASVAVALVATVLRGHRLTAWVAAVALLAAEAASHVRSDAGGWWPQELVVSGWAVVVLAVAEVVRVRAERAASFRQAAQERRRRQAGEERLRIARELHDVVAHHLSLINVQAGVALHLAGRRPENVEPALRAIKDASGEALGELRSLIDVLRDDHAPAPRAPAPTLATVDDIVERSAHAGLEVTKTVEGEVRPLPAAVELAAYRVVQEAITNVVRHAQARRAVVALGYGAELLTVRVDDDGRAGVEKAQLEQGNGLRGMHERAAALGGTLAVCASPIGGLRVELTLPTGVGQ